MRQNHFNMKIIMTLLILGWKKGAQNIILTHVCMILLGIKAMMQLSNSTILYRHLQYRKRDLSPIRRKVPVTLILHDEQYQNEAYRLVVNQ